VGLEVTAKETIEVPAGKIACFKVPLNIGRAFGSRTMRIGYVVKFEGGGATGSLATVFQRKAGHAVQFRDDQLGVSLSAPSRLDHSPPGSQQGEKGNPHAARSPS
jgi:hypothetical protein